MGGPTTRREILKAVAVAGILATPQHARAAGGETLRVGPIGSGGRGTDVATQALSADPDVKLVVMADAFEDRLPGSPSDLRGEPAIMGRMAACTGKEITWEMALNSREDPSPRRYDRDASPPSSPVAVPGQTKFR